MIHSERLSLTRDPKLGDDTSFALTCEIFPLLTFKRPPIGGRHEPQAGTLVRRDRVLTSLAMVIAVGSLAQVREQARVALAAGVTSAELEELVYEAAMLVGRIRAFEVAQALTAIIIDDRQA